ncbi:MAG TPA: IPT/TIG domain-containing protein, partial [Vicinamibacterales bacterium]
MIRIRTLAGVCLALASLSTPAAAQSISNITPTSGPTAGGTVLTISGNGFTGVFLNLTPTVTVGGANCPVIDKSSQQVLCTIPAGQGLGKTVVLSVGGNSDVASQSFNYLPPSITGAGPLSGPTTGGYALTIQGQNFGTSGSAFVGSAGCAPTSWTHGQIVCTVQAGVGTGLQIRVTVSGQSGAGPAFNYSPPTVASITPASAPTSGGSTITIVGTNFGSSGASAKIGGANCGGATNVGHTALVCTLPAGEGTNLPVVVTAGGQSSSGPTVFSYSPPAISGISPVSGAASGGYALTINGQSFGFAPTVKVGADNCAVVSKTHVQIVCTAPPGAGASAVVVHTAAGLASNAATFTYDPVVTCSPGTYVNGAACAVCPVGTYSSVMNAASCSVCPADTYAPVVGSVACQPCPAGFSSQPGSAVCAPDPVTCDAPKIVDPSTNTCVCPAPPQGEVVIDPSTCQTAPATQTVFLSAVCVSPDPLDGSKQLVRFGYENRNAAPVPLEVPYGVSSVLMVNGADAGIVSGAPSSLQPGIHTNAFTFRSATSDAVEWRVLDPGTGAFTSASPSA